MQLKYNFLKKIPLKCLSILISHSSIILLLLFYNLSQKSWSFSSNKVCIFYLSKAKTL